MFGVVPFAAATVQLANDLKLRLCTLFEMPAAVANPRYQCPICQERYQTRLELVLHLEGNCAVVPAAHLRRSAHRWPVHFVHEEAIRMLGVTPVPSFGKLDMISKDALPLRMGLKGSGQGSKHLFKHKLESEAEREKIKQYAPRLNQIRTLAKYLQGKRLWNFQHHACSRVDHTIIPLSGCN